MKEQVLTIEQMKHLAELGIDTSNASMVWSFKGFTDNSENDYIYYHNLDVFDFDKNDLVTGDVPTFTLTDILDLLPDCISIDQVVEKSKWELRGYENCKQDPKYWKYKTITNRYFFEMNKRAVWYQDYPDSTPLYTGKGKNLLDSAYDTLVWCIENNHITTNQAYE